jgi:DNA-binding NtrC family response regulator
MRMPDVDGATLFDIIVRESPRTVRILLTGYAEEAELAFARPALHELLNKPCGAAVLRGAIERQLRRHADGATLP